MYTYKVDREQRAALLDACAEMRKDLYADKQITWAEWEDLGSLLVLHLLGRCDTIEEARGLMVGVKSHKALVLFERVLAGKDLRVPATELEPDDVPAIAPAVDPEEHGDITGPIDARLVEYE